MRSLNNDSGGYTLVELLVAATIGALFMGAVATLINSNANINQKGRDQAAATSFAENKIEALRSQGYNGVPAGGPPTDITSELPNELKAPRNGNQTVTQHSTSVKKVVLSIQYNDQGRQKTVSYTALIGELGVGQY